MKTNLTRSRPLYSSLIINGLTELTSSFVTMSVDLKVPSSFTLLQPDTVVEQEHRYRLHISVVSDLGLKRLQRRVYLSHVHMSCTWTTRA